MNKTSWETKMILVLLVWCLLLAIQNGFQAYQMQRLTKSMEGSLEAIIVLQERILKP